MLTIKTAWKGGLKFEGNSVFGNPVVTDGAKSVGGGEEGAKPTELLLFGLAGCTGMDVLKMLQKMRQKVTHFELEVTGRQPDDYPKPFETVEVRYIFRGENLDPRKLEQAISLSQEKYCAVSLTVERKCTVVTSYEILKD